MPNASCEDSATSNELFKTEEGLLHFKEVYFGRFHAFSMKGTNIRDNINQESAEKAINEFGKNHRSDSHTLVAEWDCKSDYARSFEYAQKFHLKKLPKNLIRIKINEKQNNLSNAEEVNAFSKSALAVSCPLDPQFGSIPIDVFLFIYPDNELGILFFNIKLGPACRDECMTCPNITTDYLIFLIHSLFEDRFEVHALIPDYLKNIGMNNGKHKMGKIIEKYVELVLRAFKVDGPCQCELSLDTVPFVTKRILEIRDSGDGLNLCSAEEFINRYPGQTYGLMTGDEGWRFVPTEFSRERISTRWGSRDFISVLASKDGVILLNFRNTYHHKQYVDTQRELRKLFKNEVENYFNYNYNIAGMEHGPFLLLERAIQSRLILNQQIKKLDDYIKQTIKQMDDETSPSMTRKIISRIYGNDVTRNELKKIYGELNTLYSSLNQISMQNRIWEIEILYKNISSSLELDKDFDDIAKRLTYRIDYFNQIYSMRNDSLITRLSIWSIRLAWISLLVACVSIIIGAYLSGVQIYLSEPGNNTIEHIDQHFYNFWHNYSEPIANDTINYTVGSEISLKNSAVRLSKFLISHLTGAPTLEP